MVPATEQGTRMLSHPASVVMAERLGGENLSRDLRVWPVARGPGLLRFVDPGEHREDLAPAALETAIVASAVRLPGSLFIGDVINEVAESQIDVVEVVSPRWAQ